MIGAQRAPTAASCCACATALLAGGTAPDTASPPCFVCWKTPGQGSFGTVFFGKWKGQDVVLKRPNERVMGAEARARASLGYENSPAPARLCDRASTAGVAEPPSGPPLLRSSWRLR